MAEITKIEWTDATVNFWWGCSKVSLGCEHCYAEAWAKRVGEQVFGVGVPRRKVKSAWTTLRKLHHEAPKFEQTHGRRRRVFLQSMSDLFDKEVPEEWFDEAWGGVTFAHACDIQIVTKRVSYVEKRLDGREWPQHAGLIISVVNQDEADRERRARRRYRPAGKGAGGVIRLRELNHYRDRAWELAWAGERGNDFCGAFVIPSATVVANRLRCLAVSGEGWDHVSISCTLPRCPTWAEMDQIKRLFFRPDEVAMQLHPAESNHISVHPHTLHLWRPHQATIPLPPLEFV